MVRDHHRTAVFVEMATNAGTLAADERADLNAQFGPEVRFVLVDVPPALMIDGSHLNRTGAVALAEILWRLRPSRCAAMIFGDVRFYALVTGAWIAFFGLPRRLRPGVLAVSGLVFYAVFAAVRALDRGAGDRGTYLFGRGRAAAGTVIALVLALAAVKAVAWNDQSVLPTGGGVAVPLGMSFMTFELIHVAVERRRGRIDGMSLMDLTAFALFFPCRVAGPIRRYPAFMSAVADAAPSGQDVFNGLWRLLLGLAKKQLLADPLQLAVAAWPVADTPIAAWRGLLACSLWIYLDFSAYSDIAIGVSRLFGIAVPENFRWP